MRDKFVKLMYAQLGKDYIYGAKGQVFTPAKLLQYVKMLGRDRYYFYGYNAEAAAQNDIQDFDCSGLVTWCMRKLGLLSGSREYNAEAIYKELCHPIRESDLKNGDLVFRGSPINHIGMYYQGKVLHAKGTKYGVVITDEIKTFDTFGRLKNFFTVRELGIDRCRQYLKAEFGINLDYWDKVKYFDEFLYKLSQLFAKLGLL